MKTWTRLNFDKMHRCPSWSGPAFRGPVRNSRECDGGSVPIFDIREDHPMTWMLRTSACPKCGVRTLPYALIYLTWYGLTRVLPRQGRYHWWTLRLRLTTTPNKENNP